MTSIVLRRGTYYYRQRIPTDLAHHFDRRHIRRSLHTKDPNAAKALGASFAAKAQHAFAMLRTGGGGGETGTVTIISYNARCQRHNFAAISHSPSLHPATHSTTP